jgi:uncharacterized protein (DUF2235 family)
MKRLVFCFDGSWNRLNADCPTNVVLIAESVRPTARDGKTQIVYYDEGVGTGTEGKYRGGALGAGLLANLREAYRFLIFNYEPGDEIFIFGFSRGAFTARSFAGFIRHVGVLDINSASQIDQALGLYKGALTKAGDDNPETMKFRAEYSTSVCVSELDREWRAENISGFDANSIPILQIKYVGVWDTVGSLGWPNVLPGSKWLNRKLGFHDMRLTRKVQSARHALALDERRKLFRPTIWKNVAELNKACGKDHYAPDAPYQQRWFPGVHGSVGGGGLKRELSDGALSWILVGARRAHLDVSTVASSRVYQMKPDSAGPLQDNPIAPWHDRGAIGALKHFVLNQDREGPLELYDLSASARWRWYATADQLPERRLYRPGSLKRVAAELESHRPVTAGVEIKSETIVVKHGDTLGQLAREHLGDAARYMELFDANRDVIDDPDEIHPGWKLRLP